MQGRSGFCPADVRFDRVQDLRPGGRRAHVPQAFEDHQLRARDGGGDFEAALHRQQRVGAAVDYERWQADLA